MWQKCWPQEQYDDRVRTEEALVTCSLSGKTSPKNKHAPECTKSLVFSCALCQCHFSSHLVGITSAGWSNELRHLIDAFTGGGCRITQTEPFVYSRRLDGLQFCHYDSDWPKVGINVNVTKENSIERLFSNMLLLINSQIFFFKEVSPHHVRKRTILIPHKTCAEMALI